MKHVLEYIQHDAPYGIHRRDVSAIHLADWWYAFVSKKVNTFVWTIRSTV